MERYHARRLADRLARGEDAYFEELRALKAYRPPRSILAWRAIGAALVGLGGLAVFDRVTN